jgi:phosphatidylinositol-bisphosphatase
VATVKVVESSKEDEVYRQLTNELEFWRNDAAIPVVAIEAADIDFGKVKFGVKATSVIQLQNIGQCVALWRLVAKVGDGKGVSKRWLSFSQTRGLLLPKKDKDPPFEITVYLDIDAYAAHQYNAGRETFQDTVILRVEKATDTYIRINADYERSCFGMSLEDLVSAPGPVSTCPLPLPRRASRTLLP